MDVPGLSVTIRPLSSLTDAPRFGKDGYCVDIITDSEEPALKSIPSLCEKRKWQFVVLEKALGLWRVRIDK
jgi:hypothetical protein